MTIRNREFLVGLIFLLLGAGGLALSLRYNLMVGNRIGPGAFPAILASIMLFLGVVQCFAAWRTTDLSIAESFNWRPVLLIALAVLLFGVLVERIGAIPALALSAVIAGFAGGKPNFLHILGVYVVIVAFAYFVVFKLIGMQLPLFWR